MNLAYILQESWRITWRTGSLWGLALLMLILFVPLGSLTMAFSTAASLATFNDPTIAALLASIPETENLQAQLQAATALQWLGWALAAFVALVVTTTISLLVQAASMRGVVLAAEGQPASFVKVLALGRTRTISIFKISLVFGALIALLGVAPSLALLAVGRESTLGVDLIHLAQTGLTPLTTFLNVGLLLLVMSIALEDYSPRAAFGRAGLVFKQGWWAFLLVLGLSGASVFVAALLFTVPPFFVMPLIAFNVELGLYSTLGAFGCSALLALFFFLFTVVFIQALYALVYKEAARQTQAAQKGI